MKKSCLIFLICFCCKIHAQLVPNGSFEIYDTCPKFSNEVRHAVPWFDPTKASSDYYNSCVTNTLSDVQVPLNLFGYQNPRSGQAYMGLAALDFNNKINDYREYISVKLDKTLDVNKKYCLEFFVSLADSCCVSVNSIGATFSNDTLKGPIYSLLNKSQYVTSSVSLNDKTNWMKISGDFVANGSESYLTIGNYKNDLNSGLVLLCDTTNSNYKTAYYYVDDIILYDCNEFGEIIIPNVFTPNHDGVNDVLKIKLGNNFIIGFMIYDRWGLKLFETNKPADFWDGRTISGISCKDGTYFYILEYTDNSGFTKIIKGSFQLFNN